MTKPAKKSRFIPCPYCKGSGGSTKYVTGLEPPDYGCGGCQGSGGMADYKRLKIKGAAVRAILEGVDCACGHSADYHYNGYDSCAWTSNDTVNGFFTKCPCKKSQQTLLSECTK